MISYTIYDCDLVIFFFSLLGLKERRSYLALLALLATLVNVVNIHTQVLSALGWTFISLHRNTANYNQNRPNFRNGNM